MTCQRRIDVSLILTRFCGFQERLLKRRQRKGSQKPAPFHKYILFNGRDKYSEIVQQLKMTTSDPTLIYLFIYLFV